MRDAVIVAAARTPIGRAYKGAYNATPGPSLGALAIAEAVRRAGIEGGEVEDVRLGRGADPGRPGAQHRPAGGAARGAAG